MEFYSAPSGVKRFFRICKVAEYSMQHSLGNRSIKRPIVLGLHIKRDMSPKRYDLFWAPNSLPGTAWRTFTADQAKDKSMLFGWEPEAVRFALATIEGMFGNADAQMIFDDLAKFVAWCEMAEKTLRGDVLYSDEDGPYEVSSFFSDLVTNAFNKQTKG